MGKGAPATGALDGKVVVVERANRGGKPDGKDTLTFANGRFRSRESGKYGFGDGVYTTIEKDGAIYFEAETFSPTMGKMKWNGRVRNESIEAHYVWTNPPPRDGDDPGYEEKWLWGNFRM